MANRFQSAAVERYKQKAYDRIDIRIPKGRKKELEEFLKNKNISVNQFLNDFVKYILFPEEYRKSNIIQSAEMGLDEKH